IRLHTRFGPKRIQGSDGKVTGIELIKASRVFDENRRFNPQFIEGSEETLDCDTVVLAIGQSADLSWIHPEDNLKLTPRGTLQTDPQTMATSRPDVFAGGSSSLRSPRAKRRLIRLRSSSPVACRPNRARHV